MLVTPLTQPEPRFASLACPYCRAALTESGPDRLGCTACGKGFDVLLGIPDLRVADGPYITNVGDRAKAERIAAAYDGSRFADLVALYYRLTPEVPPDDAARFTEALLSAPERAQATLESWLAMDSRAMRPGCRFADVGCGTAPMLVAARGLAAESIGVDVSLRWLVIAKKRLDEAGLPVRLVCANAEALPLADGVLDAVAFDSTLEHCRDGARAVTEAARVLSPGGKVLVSTPNRFSLGPDPHLGMWAAGWLPAMVTRWWAARKAALVPVRHLVSSWELRRWLDRGGFQAVQLSNPPLSSAQRSRLGGVGARLAGAYNELRGRPGVSGLLRLVGPILHGVARRGAEPPA